MEYKTHIVTSMTFAVPMLSVTDELTMINLGAVVLGSLFPDIDHPRSYVAKKPRLLVGSPTKLLVTVARHIRCWHWQLSILWEMFLRKLIWQHR